jgi:predicted HTH domain antitoxin
MRTVVLDDELAALLEGEQDLEHATRETLVMELFRRGKVSSGKAAELLRIPRVDFLHRASDLKIPVISMSPEEWEAEKATIDAWLKP